MLLVSCLLVAVLAGSRTVLETSHPRPVSNQYRHLSRMTNGDVRLTFAVKLRNVAELEQEFWDRSNPKHELYGKWLSIDDLAARFAPTANTIAVVKSALVRAGGKNVTSSRMGMIESMFNVKDAESLLQTEFHLFHHLPTNRRMARSRDGVYSLPSELASQVDFVEGVRNLPRQRYYASSRPRPRLRSRARAGVGVSPHLIRQRYQTVGVSGSPNANNSNCVAQFIGQHYSQGDLDEFFTLFDSGDKGRKPIIHGNDGGSPGVEANLDIQYITAVGYGVRDIYFWVTPRTDNHPFTDFFADLANTSVVPLVISVSYGEAETDSTPVYLNRLNSEFQIVGLRGVSILFASGDSGVSADGTCPNNRFDPDWPATSPYLTSVGGTHLGFLETGSESAWSGSGGGFSTLFSQPAYQVAQVQNYLKQQSGNLPPQQYWNATGRSYPDVAAFSENFWVVIDRVPQPVSGTSCACPTFSGVISLLNDIRIQQGKRSLGPLNQWLYQIAPQALNDVTKGCNQGCLGQNGFCATTGFDPVTGLGSPNYQKMKALLP